MEKRLRKSTIIYCCAILDIIVLYNLKNDNFILKTRRHNSESYRYVCVYRKATLYKISGGIPHNGSGP